MSFMGADTDALREAGQECQEGKDKTDQVIHYLQALIMALRAASFFTGGASAAYAEYLEGTVVPWLQRISQALGLMAKVLLQNAHEQDDVSKSGSQISGASRTAIAYSTPGGSMPTQAIGVWEGSLVPDTAPGTSSDTGSSISSVGNTPGASTGGFSPAAATSPTSAPTGSWATGDHVGQFTHGGVSSMNGSSTGSTTDSGSVDQFGLPAGSHRAGSDVFTGQIEAADHAGGPVSGGIGSGGTGGHTGIGSGIDSGIGSASGSGSGGSGSGSIGGGSIGGGGSGDGESTDSGGGLSSYATKNSLDGLGGATPNSGSHGDAGLGAPTGGGEGTSGDGKAFGPAAGIAGGAAALGLGGAALAGRSGANSDKRVDELAAQNGRNSSGPGVTELQQRLTDAGYDTKGTDGAWGRNTQAAYDAYRQDHPMTIQQGAGYSSPSGFDYNKITGVANNRNVTPEFLRGVEGVAQRIGAKPEHLMAVMSFETGGKFGADTPTKAQGGTAVGLIQFTPIARDQVNVSRDQLIHMTPTQQLTYVEKYFEPRKGPELGSIAGLYSAVLGGKASTDLERVQISGPGHAYEMNKGLDTNHDHKITVREGAARIERALSGH